jgi:hypothetical protein
MFIVSIRSLQLTGRVIGNASTQASAIEALAIASIRASDKDARANVFDRQPLLR